jgi:phosphoribosylaminoimidazole-succinocarboxamide synthase
MKPLYSTDYKELKLFRRGKVRDVYEIEDKLLIVATDRISAFDVIMSQPIPEKGSILSKISAFWFENSKEIVPNHFITNKIIEYPENLKKYSSELEGRSMLVRRSNPLPLECIVRGYVAGSGWKEYKQHRTICGITLPDGLIEHSKLPEPIFTPSTKAEEGHDENISFPKATALVGEEIANKVRNISIDLYNFANNYLESVGLILADTKFEFGINNNGEIILIDEALTPDSSRFWLKDDYSPGKPIVQFDKQPLRDYLESIKWNKLPPPPVLPNEVLESTTERYKEALKRILKLK